MAKPQKLYIVIGQDLQPFMLKGKRMQPTADLNAAKRIVDANPGEAVVVDFKEWWDNTVESGALVGLADIDLFEMK